MNLLELQSAVGEWSKKNFGEGNGTNSLLGLQEELGELAHAHLKGLQGIRYSPREIQEAKMDSVGDLVIYLCDYCEREGLRLEICIAKAWRQVKARDWKANPIHAADSTQEKT